MRGMCVDIKHKQDGSTFVASLFCKFDIVRVTLQDSDPSPSGPVIRETVHGWGQSWDLGDLAIYYTCNVSTHTHTHYVYCSI